MRRAWVLGLAALLLSGALPAAHADGGGDHAKHGRPALAPPPEASAQQADSAAASPVSVPPEASWLAVLSGGSVALLALALAAARASRRVKPRKLPRRGFEAGRAMGLASRVASAEDAIAALQRPAVGALVGAERLPGAVRVALRRRRGEPCELAAGYLTGLFECGWATDVTLRHDICGGKQRNAVCQYEVRPADAVSRVVAPAAEASIRG